MTKHLETDANDVPVEKTCKNLREWKKPRIAEIVGEETQAKALAIPTETGTVGPS